MSGPTPTASLRLMQQFTGENINVWGTLLNVVLQLLDAAIAGCTAITLTGDYRLSSANYVADEARNFILKFAGTPATPCVVSIPAVSKAYVVWNGSTQAVTITTGAGSTVTVDASDVVFIVCDGSNVTTLGYGGLDLKSFIAASVLAATGSLPGTAGNAGKYVFTDGNSSFWKAPAVADLADYSTKILGVQVALATAL